MKTYKKHYNWANINYKHLAFSKTREHVKGVSGPCGHYALCGHYGKHNKSTAPCVSHIMNKTKTSTLDQNWACANYGIYVGLVWYVINNMSSKPRTNFPSDGVRTVDPTAKLTKMKWPCCGTIQCSQVTYINHRYMKLTLFLLLNNLIFTLRIPVKISGITNLTHKLISMVQPRVK